MRTFTAYFYQTSHQVKISVRTDTIPYLLAYLANTQRRTTRSRRENTWPLSDQAQTPVQVRGRIRSGARSAKVTVVQRIGLRKADVKLAAPPSKLTPLGPHRQGSYAERQPTSKFSSSGSSRMSTALPRQVRQRRWEGGMRLVLISGAECSVEGVVLGIERDGAVSSSGMLGVYPLASPHWPLRA